MGKKLTIDIATYEFEKRGHTLVSKFYVNNKTKMEYNCKCGKEHLFISLSHLKQGYNNCKNCSGEKKKQTCLEKFGYEHPFQNEEIKEKYKQTCLEKFGCENPSQNEEIKEKYKLTCLEKFG